MREKEYTKEDLQGLIKRLKKRNVLVKEIYEKTGFNKSKISNIQRGTNRKELDDLINFIKAEYKEKLEISDDELSKSREAVTLTTLNAKIDRILDAMKIKI